MKKVKEFLEKAVLDMRTRQKIGETGDSSNIGTGKPKTPQEDPFAWYDTKHKKTLGELQIRHKTGKPIQIHTSSDLIGHDDYAAAIPKGSEINLYSHGHYPNTTPGFPSEQRLSDAGKKLQSLGHKVNYHGFSEKPPRPKRTGTGTTLKVAKSKLEKDVVQFKPKQKPQSGEETLQDKTQRIGSSLNRINQLMSQVRAMKDQGLEVSDANVSKLKPESGGQPGGSYSKITNLLGALKAKSRGEEPQAPSRQNMTRDEKIKAALAAQGQEGSPYSDKRPGFYGKDKTEEDLIEPNPKMQEAIDKQRAKQGVSDSIYDDPKEELAYRAQRARDKMEDNARQAKVSELYANAHGPEAHKRWQEADNREYAEDYRVPGTSSNVAYGGADEAGNHYFKVRNRRGNDSKFAVGPDKQIHQIHRAPYNFPSQWDENMDNSTDMPMDQAVASYKEDLTGRWNSSPKAHTTFLKKHPKFMELMGKKPKQDPNLPNKKDFEEIRMRSYGVGPKDSGGEATELWTRRKHGKGRDLYQWKIKGDTADAGAMHSPEEVKDHEQVFHSIVKPWLHEKGHTHIVNHTGTTWDEKEAKEKASVAQKEQENRKKFTVVKSLQKSEKPHGAMMKCLMKCKSMMTNQKDPLVKQDMSAMAPPAPDSGAAMMPQQISGTN